MWFYNKEISILTYGNIKDSHGINRPGYTPVATDEPILVDIQPYSNEQVKKDYGYDIECTKRMFCDIIPQITESAVIQYNSQYYDIKKIVPWDDYLDVMLLERKETTIVGGKS